MSRQGVVGPGLVLAGVALLGLCAGQTGTQPHARMALAAAGVMFVAALAAGCAEALVSRRGGEALVLGYWVGVGVRAIVGFVGAMFVVRFGFDSQDRQALVLWLLAAYLTVLVFETVRQVRDADRARLAKTALHGTERGSE